jgi:hypothetical protein
MADAVRKLVVEEGRGERPIGEARLSRPPAFLAFQVLRFIFTVAPIVAGLDKFFHFLVNWDQYLAPQAQNVLGTSSHGFMLVVGVIEIIAGIGVALKPKFFGFVVSAWMLAIAANLVIGGRYLDVALRDLGLCFGAFALGCLGRQYEFPGFSTRRLT